MDCDVSGYKQARYDEIANEMRNMLAKVGWKKDFLEGQVPYMPISGWCGDNLVKKTTNMSWWKGNEMRNMLAKVGWKKDFIEKQVPYMPISGWCGDNLVKKTTNMSWWKGADVAVGSETVHCDTLVDCLNDMCRVPERPIDA